MSDADATNARRPNPFLMIWKASSRTNSIIHRIGEVVELPMAYRSRMEIQAAMLEAAIGGSSKTRVMYGAGLSYFQMSSYLKELEAMGLVEYDKLSRQYRTSQKGKDFLKSFRQLTVFIDS